MRSRCLLVASVMALLVGCGVRDPYGARRAGSLDATLRTFALASVNWTARDLVRSELRRLQLATGRLRVELRQGLSTAQRDRRSQLVSRGEVLAVAPGGYVVVRETVSDRGRRVLGETAVHVYRAHTVQRNGRWMVASWRVVQ